MTFKVADFKFIHGIEFTKSHVAEAIEIDKLYYAKDDMATLETCYSWQNKNPEIYSGIIDISAGILAGYIIRPPPLLLP